MSTRVAAAVGLIVALACAGGCKRLMGGGADDDSGKATASAAPLLPPPPSAPTPVAQDPIAVASGVAPGADTAPPPDASGAPAASAAPTAQAAAPANPPPNTATTPVRGQNIDACCGALNVFERGARPLQRQRVARAASLCPGIADAVRSGRSTRAAGLAQIRAQLGGGATPSACQ
ncbi:MAG TPA: hypothetical protein VGM56_23935 [Byssovorax sp.]|jgi:hypothetical protein